MRFSVKFLLWLTALVAVMATQVAETPRPITLLAAPAYFVLLGRYIDSHPRWWAMKIWMSLQTWVLVTYLRGPGIYQSENALPLLAGVGAAAMFFLVLQIAIDFWLRRHKDSVRIVR